MVFLGRRADLRLLLTLLINEFLKSAKRFLTDMVLDTLGIHFGGFFTDAERFQEFKDDDVTLLAGGGELFAFFSQKRARGKVARSRALLSSGA